MSSYKPFIVLIFDQSISVEIYWFIIFDILLCDIFSCRMFGRLEKGTFTRDSRKISATTDLQWVFDTLNWIFSKANEQSD
jgi:hypothetical protein